MNGLIYRLKFYVFIVSTVSTVWDEVFLFIKVLHLHAISIFLHLNLKVIQVMAETVPLVCNILWFTFFCIHLLLFLDDGLPNFPLFELFLVEWNALFTCWPEHLCLISHSVQKQICARVFLLFLHHAVYNLFNGNLS